jgi:hypothetical protein
LLSISQACSLSALTRQLALHLASLFPFCAHVPACSLSRKHPLRSSASLLLISQACSLSALMRQLALHLASTLRAHAPTCSPSRKHLPFLRSCASLLSISQAPSGPALHHGYQYCDLSRLHLRLRACAVLLHHFHFICERTV